MPHTTTPRPTRQEENDKHVRLLHQHFTLELAEPARQKESCGGPAKTGKARHAAKMYAMPAAAALLLSPTFSHLAGKINSTQLLEIN